MADFRIANIKGWGSGPRNPGLLQLNFENLNRIVRNKTEPKFSQLAREVKSLRTYISRCGLQTFDCCSRPYYVAKSNITMMYFPFCQYVTMCKISVVINLTVITRSCVRKVIFTRLSLILILGCCRHAHYKLLVKITDLELSRVAPGRKPRLVQISKF